MKYRIGKVAAVTGDEVFISISDYTDVDEPSGVPASMSIDLPSENGPVPLLIGQPGTYVLVSLPASHLLCMVTGIEMKEERISQGDLKQAGSESVLLTDRVSRSISAVPVGTIAAGGLFERGADTMPTVCAPVFAVDSAMVEKVYREYAEGDFSLGKLSLIPEQAAKINLDAFLTRHAAILGQTGGGKSWAVASVIQKDLSISPIHRSPIRSARRICHGIWRRRRRYTRVRSRAAVLAYELGGAHGSNGR